VRAAELLRRAKDALAPSPDAEWDARALLADALNAEPSALARRLSQEVPDARAEEFFAAVRRRAAGEPLQYVLGRAWFMGLPFQVDARVLIPRQDTELLCETALREAKAAGAAEALDLCTGSGAVAVALARLGGLSVTATDLSPEALDLARENARQNGVAVAFYEGDLFSALPAGLRFPLITCNPPYLTAADMRALQPEVRREPALALFGGEDGLAFYRRLAKEAPSRLLPGGTLLLEIGSTQGAAVCALFSGWSPAVLRDLNGLDRVVLARAPGTASN
jgi:release factor glutamine methyltransferase